MGKLKFDEVNVQIRTMVREKLNLNVELDHIDDNLLFGTASGFDSTSLLEFILSLEEHFDVIVPDDDLTPANFGSISKITNYIIKLKEV